MQRIKEACSCIDVCERATPPIAANDLTTNNFCAPCRTTLLYPMFFLQVLGHSSAEMQSSLNCSRVVGKTLQEGWADWAQWGWWTVTTSRVDTVVACSRKSPSHLHVWLGRRVSTNIRVYILYRIKLLTLFRYQPQESRESACTSRNKFNGELA